MHIPDGYLSPATCAVMYGAAAPFWYTAGHRLKRQLTGEMVPLLAVFSAFSFTAMMFNIPVPGGTTAHAVGGTLAAIVLGPWAAIISVSVALVIQALFFGDGGITAIGANCFNMAIILPLVGYSVYLLVARNAPIISRRRLVAAGIGSYVGINAAALLVGLQLGIQPEFWSEHGKALYAPYSLGKAIPAMMLAHLTIAGAAEAIATVAALAYLQQAHPEILRRRTAAVASPAPSRRLPRWLLPVIVGAVVLLVPLGLLASGTAWGEWDARELQAKPDIGYVPSGLHKYQAIWSAPFSDYSMPWVPENASFSEQAIAYILAAVIGIGLIFVVVFAARILSRRFLARKTTSVSA